MSETKILGLKTIKVGNILHLKDGNFKLKHIEVINMAVDRFVFEDRESIFSDELKEEMTNEEFNKLREK